MARLYKYASAALLIAIFFTKATYAAAKSSGATASSAKQVDAVRLSMNGEFYGKLDVLVSPMGCRFTSFRTGMQLVALPPDGRMYAFNDEAKRICKVDMNRLLMPGVYRKQFDDTKSKAKFFPTGKRAKIAGVDAAEFANYRKETLAAFRRFRIKAVRSGYPQQAVLPSEIWAATDLTIPQAFVVIVSKITQISENELFQLYSSSKERMKRAPIPLRVFQVTDDGRKMLTIDTKAVVKTKASAKDFQLPTGYTTVANEFQLLMGDDNMDFEALDSKNVKSHPTIKTPPGIKFPF